MRVLRRTFAALILVGFASASMAQGSPPRDPQAIQMLTQSYLLMGGAQRAAVSDVRVEGTLASPDSPTTVIGTFVAKARGQDMSVEVTKNGETSSFRVLSGRGSISGKGKTKGLAPYRTQGLSLDILPLFSRWTEFAKDSSAVSGHDTIELDGVSCHLVRVTVEEQSDERSKNEHGTREVLIDVRTGLPAAIRYEATQGPFQSDKVLIENRFANYADYSGFLIPTQVTRYISGRAVVLLRVESVRLNVGLSDADFSN